MVFKWGFFDHYGGFNSFQNTLGSDIRTSWRSLNCLDQGSFFWLVGHSHGILVVPRLWPLIQSLAHNRLYLISLGLQIIFNLW